MSVVSKYLLTELINISFYSLRLAYVFFPLIVQPVNLEPASLRNQLHSDGGAAAGKTRLLINEDIRAEDSKVLMVSSSRSERTEARVSSSAIESRYYVQI